MTHDRVQLRGPAASILMLLVILAAASASESSFPEVDFWIGTGNHSAALVIDWDERPTFGPSLVWGYRWDGVASGEDLLRAVLQADARAFAKVNALGTLGVAVNGFGYDWNGDGALELTDATDFGPDGIAVSGPSDLAMAVDPSDVYAEGWFSSGFWHYTTASDTGTAGAPEWTSANVSMMQRQLTDGAWDGWTFTSFIHPDGTVKTLEELLSTSPGEPLAAPSARRPGDFNVDGFVDVADYTIWRDHLHESVGVPGAVADADFSGFVDAVDYQHWRDAFRVDVSQGVGARQAIPEPTASQLMLLALAGMGAWAALARDV